MAGLRTGTPSIWKHAVAIKNLKSTYGASDMTAKLGSQFTTCVNALVACVIEVYGTDDLPLQIDYSAPLGPEDIGPP